MYRPLRQKHFYTFECMLKRRGNVKIAVIENFDDILGTNKKLDLTNSASSSETHLLLTLR